MRIFIALLIILYKVPLINILGDKGMGYYSIAFSLYMLLITCIAYGMPKAVCEVITAHYTKGNYKSVFDTVKCSLLFSALTGFIFALILYISSDIIATIFMTAAYSSYAIRAISPCLFLASVLGALHGIFISVRATAVSTLLQSIESILIAGLTIAGGFILGRQAVDEAAAKNEPLYEYAHTSMGAALGLTVALLITCIIASIIYCKYHKKLKCLTQKDQSDKKTKYLTIINKIIISMLPFAATLAIFHLSSVTDYMIFNHMMKVQGYDENSYIILLGMLNGKYEFFISIPLIFISWITASKIPLLKEIANQQNRRKLHVKTGQILRQTMIVCIPCCIIYLLFAGPLMNVFFTGFNEMPALLLRIGSISIVFYSLAVISNSLLTALDEWGNVAKNAVIALVIQAVCLTIMIIFFQWGMIAVVISRVVFSICLCILNEHKLRERTGFVQDYNRIFKIPVISSMIMGLVSWIIYLIINLILAEWIALLISIIIGIIIYLLGLIALGGISQKEMYRIPGGKIIAPMCRKLHLVH